jgi:hypothetical protein
MTNPLPCPRQPAAGAAWLTPLILCLSVFFVLCSMRFMVRAKQLEKDPELIDRQVHPPAGPATRADDVLKALRVAYYDLPDLDPAAVDAHAPLRDLLIRTVTRDLVLPGDAPMLNQDHDLESLRTMNDLLLADVLSLLRERRGGEAIAVVEALERVRRIAGRGTKGWSSLAAKVNGLVMLRRGTRMLEAALDQGLMGPGSRMAFAVRCYGDEVPLDECIRAEMEADARRETIVRDYLWPLSLLVPRREPDPWVTKFRALDAEIRADREKLIRRLL